MASREWNNEGLEYRDWYKGIYKIWGPISAFPADHQKVVLASTGSLLFRVPNPMALCQNHCALRNGSFVRSRRKV